MKKEETGMAYAIPYIDRNELVDQIVKFEKTLKNDGDEHGAWIANKCRGIVLDQEVITAVWNGDVCSKCHTKTEGAMERKYDWCPVCGAEMMNDWDGDEPE